MIATKLKIRLFGDQILRKKTAPVKEVGPAERILIASMLETMREFKGVGLAAPQVGISEQILVVEVGEETVALINPKILKKSGGTEKMEEGCLSIPGIGVAIRRAKKIKVKYLDQDNHVVERDFTELLARVIQHEVDHLNGKLITDYLSLTGQLKVKDQLRALEKAVKEEQIAERAKRKS